MSRDYDRDDRDDDRRPDDARRRVATPATLLIISGGIALLLSGFGLVTAFTNPNVIVDVYQKSVIDPLPEGPQKEQIKKEFDQQKDGMRLNSPVNIGSYALGFLLNLVTVVGGFKMRGLSGYGLSMAGAVTAILPLGGCCCLTSPIGIWALVVLLNPEVKRAFGVGRPEPQDDFDRDSDRDDRR